MSAAFAVVVAPKPTATTQERFRVLTMSAAFAVVVAPKPTATICQAAPKTTATWYSMVLAMQQRDKQPPTWLVRQYRPQPKSLQAAKSAICSTPTTIMHGIKICIPMDILCLIIPIILYRAILRKKAIHTLWLAICFWLPITKLPQEKHLAYPLERRLPQLVMR